MTFEEYLHAVRFRFLQPHTRLTAAWTYALNLHPRQRLLLERLNTVLPRDRRDILSAMRRLCMGNRLATLAMGMVLNKAVASMRPDAAYVNVGVWRGFSLFAGMEGNPDRICVGVDNFSEIANPAEFYEAYRPRRTERHRFFERDYRDYFRHEHRCPIGVYYYDGHHAFEHQLNGLLIAEPFFTDDCVVVVDDTNWEEPRAATMEFLRRSGNRYRVIDLPTTVDRHPTWWNGLLILLRER